MMKTLMKVLLGVFLVFIVFPLLVVLMVDSDNENSSVPQQTQQRDMAQELKQQFAKHSSEIISRIKKEVKAGHVEQAFALARKYKRAGVNDPELNKILAQLAPKMKKIKEKRLLAQAKHIPASDIEANIKVYRQLVRLNSTNKYYRQKLEYYEKKKKQQEQERQRRLAMFGDPPVRSSWDGSYPVIERYLKKVAHDPDSIEIVKCTDVFYTKSGWLVGCYFRGRNAFGAKVMDAKWFTIRFNQVIKVEDANAYRWR